VTPAVSIAPPRCSAARTPAFAARSATAIPTRRSPPQIDAPSRLSASRIVQHPADDVSRRMPDDQLELVVRGGTVVTAEGQRQADVGIAGGKVVRIDDRAPGGTGTPRGTRDIDPRDGHLAIRVLSYDDTVQHLRSHGIECVESPRNVTPWAQIYVTDPDGNVVEFNTDAPHS